MGKRFSSDSYGSERGKLYLHLFLLGNLWFLKIEKAATFNRFTAFK